LTNTNLSPRNSSTELSSFEGTCNRVPAKLDGLKRTVRRGAGNWISPRSAKRPSATRQFIALARPSSVRQLNHSQTCRANSARDPCGRARTAALIRRSTSCEKSCPHTTTLASICAQTATNYRQCPAGGVMEHDQYSKGEGSLQETLTPLWKRGEGEIFGRSERELCRELLGQDTTESTNKFA